jgi:hypothetical protein
MEIPGMIPTLRKPTDAEKRRYIRHPIDEWLLLFNSRSIIDMAQVINISRGGALCASLAETCPPEMVEEFELYGPDCSLTVNGLCAKIIHTDYTKPSSASSQEINCFIFGLQFFRATPDQLRKIEQITQKRK